MKDIRYGARHCVYTDRCVEILLRERVPKLLDRDELFLDEMLKREAGIREDELCDAARDEELEVLGRVLGCGCAKDIPRVEGLYPDSA